MNTPPTKQQRAGYVNPFMVGSTNIQQNDVKQYHKLDVQDNLTRIIQGKNTKPAGASADNEATLSAYNAVNEQIASSLLARNDEPFKILKVKPENEAIGTAIDQKYTPHKANCKLSSFHMNI